MRSDNQITVQLPIWIQTGKNRHYLNLNQYRNWYFRLSNNIKTKFKEQVKDSLDFSFLGKVEIDYTYYAPDNRKRDLMNVISVADKFFQDAMTECNCIPSDDTKTVVKVICRYGGVDKGNPRIEATIKNYAI